MSRYWRVYKTFFLSSIARELEFRANFFARCAQSIGWLIFGLFIVLIIFRNTESVAGWSRGDAMLLLSSTYLMNTLFKMFAMGLTEIPEHVRKGSLDFIITKPIDTQFWISTRKFHFEQIGVLFVSFGMLFYAVKDNIATISAIAWLSYFALMFCSLIIFYSINFMLMTLGIYFVRVENLWVFGETIHEVVRFPGEIFPARVMQFFTWGLPIAFLTWVPTRQLIKGFQLSDLLMGAGWACVLFLVARAFWFHALKSYTSASS